MSVGGLRLGYLVPEFPAQTHIFFWREAQALASAGVNLTWISTRRPLVPCPHEFAAGASGSTHYVYPPRLGSSLRQAARHPTGVLRCLRYLAGLGESTLGGRARRLGLVACAADLADLAASHGLTHLHVHSCADGAHLAALANRLFGIPYSLTLHGDLPVYGTDHRSKMAAARFVSVVTRDLQDQVVSRVGLDRSRVPVIRMGVNTDHFTPASEPPDGGGTFHFVTVARLAECKGHRYALMALRSLLDEGIAARYTIAGSGPDRASIEDEVSRLALNAHVRFAGSLSEPQVLELLHSAHAFVLPSIGLGEAAPVAVMEAMATGLPVACTIIGGVPELVSDGREGFLVQQADAGALAAALRRFAVDPGLRTTMGRMARDRAALEFGADRSASALLDQILLVR